MGLFDWFPYTNFHELNIDWVLRKVRELNERVEKLEIQIASIKDEIMQEVQAKLDELKTELTDLIDQKLDECKEEVLAKIKDLQDALDALTATVTQEVNAIKQELSDLSDDYNAFKSAVTNELNSINQQLDDLGKSIDALLDTVGNINDSIDALQKKVKDIGDQLTSIGDDVQNNTQEINNIKTTVAGHTTDITNLKGTVAGHTTSIATITSQIQAINGDIEQLQDQLNGDTESLQASITTLTARVKALEDATPQTITETRFAGAGSVFTIDNINGRTSWPYQEYINTNLPTFKTINAAISFINDNYRRLPSNILIYLLNSDELTKNITNLLIDNLTIEAASTQYTLTISSSALISIRGTLHLHCNLIVKPITTSGNQYHIKCTEFYYNGFNDIKYVNNDGSAYTFTNTSDDFTHLLNLKDCIRVILARPSSRLLILADYCDVYLLSYTNAVYVASNPQFGRVVVHKILQTKEIDIIYGEMAGHGTVWVDQVKSVFFKNPSGDIVKYTMSIQ